MERVPTDRPVMILPNHQSALMDPLLYAAFAKGKPYFLTRSDVFQNPVLKWIFEGLRMMPVYRLRDGRETLGRNQEVFERCAALFSQGEQLLLFPEANHSLRRRVRPLSKGFTRILSQGYTQHPELDIAIVPAGMNYQAAARFPDRVAMFFGQPINTRGYWSEQRQELDFNPLRECVFEAITELTTHVPTDMNYEKWEAALEEGGTDFLDPATVNLQYKKESPPVRKKSRGGKSLAGQLWDWEFRLINAPVWLPWRWISKNRVPEPEFMSTFRFLYCLIVFPLYFLLAGVLLSLFTSVLTAITALSLLFLHNFIYVKLR